MSPIIAFFQKIKSGHLSAGCHLELWPVWILEFCQRIRYKRLQLIVLFLAMIVNIGCEKDLEWEDSRQGGELVLFSFLSPDSVFSVHLSKSVSHSSVDDFERVYNGNITVYKNSGIVDDFIFPFDKSWASRKDFQWQSGDTVKIEAADGQGERVFAQTVIPDAVRVELTDTSVVARTTRNNGPEEVLQCQLVIDDPAGEENYYQLVVFEQICMAGLSNVCEETRIDFSKDDPVFYVRNLEGSLIGGLDFGGCFSDHIFDGQQYELTLNLPVQYASAPNDPQADRKLLFVLLSHTREYYDYYRSRVVAEYGYDLPLIDPIRIFNNVNDGIGLVAGYNSSVDSLVFENGHTP